MEVTLGGVAGLIAAIAFVVLVGFLIYPLIRLGKLFDQLSQTVKDTGDHAIPALDEGTGTVQKLNKTLDDVNDVTDALSTSANNVSALTDLYGALLGKPAIKVASTVYAVKQTAADFFSKNSGKKRGHVVDSTVADTSQTAPQTASSTTSQASSAAASGKAGE